MLDSLKSYPLHFIQKASPGEGDAFDFAYIYKFYTERTERYQRLKYIMRVEAYEDVFAIKFYAARDRQLDDKYNRTLRVHKYKGAIRTFLTCAEVVLQLYAQYPFASFIVQGASSKDFISGKEENGCRTQRYRIYSRMAFSLFSNEKFYHTDEENSSIYMLINRHNCPDVEQKAERIKQMFFARGFDM